MIVRRNARGYRIGDSHQAAKLSDHEVELILRLREEGWSYGTLARKFEISKSHIRDIVKGRRRA